MSQSDYIFTDTQFSSELTRLKKLEQVYDPISRQQIIATGIAPGWQCLEIGAGAGSMMRWLSEIVGTSGQSYGDSTSIRALSKILKLANVEIIEADIHQVAARQVVRFGSCSPRVNPSSRYFTTNPNCGNCLKPGGWLVIEESDFSATRFISGTASTTAGDRQ